MACTDCVGDEPEGTHKSTSDQLFLRISKALSTGWLETTETNCPMILETKNLKSRCQQNMFPLTLTEEEFCLASFSFWEPRVSHGLWQCDLVLPQFHVPLSLFSSVHICVCFQKPLVILDWVPPQWLHLNLITSAETFFLNKVTSWDTEG